MAHPRDLIVVRGPDAASYLQGQLSQDVVALDLGASAPTLLLEPSGKLGYWFTVTRIATDAFELAVDAGFGEAVAARLERFKIRTDAEVVLTPAGTTSTPADPNGANELGEDDEGRRIDAGVPRLGREIIEGVIPAELGQALIEASVSFTKGCYTGQELVARVDSRGGNVPRHLRHLSLDGPEVPPVGAELVVDDKVVGTITSAAATGASGSVVALGFVQRAVVPPAMVEVRWDGGSDQATVAALASDAAPA